MQDDEQCSLLSKIDRSLLDESQSLTYLSSLPFRAKRFFLNLLYFVSVNLLPTILIFFVNKKYPKEKDIVVSVGAANTITNLTLTPLIVGIASTLEIIGSQAYASKKYVLFGYYMNRLRIVGIFAILTVSIGMLVLGEFYYSMIGYDLRTQHEITLILVFRIFASFLDLEFCLLLRFLQIIDKGMNAMIFSFISFLSFGVYCHLFLIILNLKFLGIGLVYLSFFMTNIVPIWIYLKVTRPLPQAIFFFDRHCFDNLKGILKLAFPLYAINLMDYFNTEIMSIFAAFYGKDNNHSFILAISIYYIFNSFYLGYNVLTTLSVSHYIGKNDQKSAKKIIGFIYLDVTIIGIILLSITIPLRSFFLSHLSFEKEAIQTASNILLVFIFINFIENYLGIALSVLRGLKKVYYLMLVYVSLNLIYFSILSVLNSRKPFGILDIPLSYLLINFLSILAYSLPLLFIDWEEHVRENLRALECDQNELDNSFIKGIK